MDKIFPQLLRKGKFFEMYFFLQIFTFSSYFFTGGSKNYIDTTTPVSPIDCRYEWQIFVSLYVFVFRN